MDIGYAHRVRKKMNKKILKIAGFKKEIERMDNNQCPTCGKVIFMIDLKDALSKKEFKISGMCQSCQNKVFREEK